MCGVEKFLLSQRAYRDFFESESESDSILFKSDSDTDSDSDSKKSLYALCGNKNFSTPQI